MHRAVAFVALVLIADPSFATEERTCSQQIMQTEYILTGMFTEKPDVVSNINGFPLISSGQQIAYAKCPVIEMAGIETVSCGVGILERQGDVLLPVQQFDLEGCSGGDDQAEDCPMFTAEGFTMNNGGQLAEILKRHQDQICAKFGTGPVVELRPVATPGKSFPGLDGSTFFEIMSDCAELDAGTGCTAALEAAQGEIAGVTRVMAGADQLACAVAADGALLACGILD